MGLFDSAKKFVKSQLIDVIEWKDDTRDTMVYRFPMGDKEIMNNAKLTVRESQVAIFVNEGQLADVFRPGLYPLNTENLPILTKLKSWKYGFDSPFKSEVYFINTKQFTDQKWGTSNPIMMRDADFGMIRIRAYGIYTFRVGDAVKFMKEVFGTNALFTVDGINNQLRKTIVSSMTDAIGEAKIPALDIASQYDELGELVRAKMMERFGDKFGLEIPELVIENISLPEEVEKAIDQRSALGTFNGVNQGTMNTYTQFQAANAIKDAAKNEGMGGAAVSMGAGMGFGQVIAGSMAGAMAQQQQYQQQQMYQQQPYQQQPYQQAPPQYQQAPQGGTVPCIKCGNPLSPGSKFCPECGSPQVRKCPKCGVDVGTAKFCSECGTKVE